MQKTIRRVNGFALMGAMLTACGGGGGGDPAPTAVLGDTISAAPAPSSTPAPAPAPPAAASPLPAPAPAPSPAPAPTPAVGQPPAPTTAQWPVSLVLVRGMSLTLEQCFGNTLSNGTFAPCYASRTQNVVRTATGGRTAFAFQGAGVGQVLYDWTVTAEQFAVTAWESFNNSGGSRCTSPSSITPAPLSATIGASGDLAVCTVSQIPGSGTSQQTLRWSVTASAVPGRALVCLADYCYRTDASGNVDASKYPWAPE